MNLVFKQMRIPTGRKSGKKKAREPLSFVTKESVKEAKELLKSQGIKSIKVSYYTI